MAKTHYKIGELANLVDLSVRTLHHYDHIGLLVPSKHPDSGHRVYDKNDIGRLQQILSLRNIGFTLDEIKNVLMGETLSPLEIANMHMKRIRVNLQLQQTLLKRLELIEQQFATYKNIPIKNLIETIEAIMMSEQKSVNNLSRAVPIMHVSDYEKSMLYYTEKLGFRKNWEWGEPADFGSVSRDQVEIFLTEEKEGNYGTSLNVFVKNVDSLYVEVKKNGASIIMAPKMMQWGKELRVVDPDEHIIRFTQTSSSEKIVVERTEIRPKIEKRLAALIEELASETERSVGELLEETLLHSFEAIPGQEGQASASPHTIETLDLIEQLKRKHKLDYDTHNIYGFIEEAE